MQQSLVILTKGVIPFFMDLRPLRVLLINPPPFKILEPWYDAPDFPRLGLASLAAYLRRNMPVEIMIIDAKLERETFTGVVKRGTAFSPDVVGLTAFTNEIEPAAHLARMLKAELPEAIFVIGGVHITALPVATLEEFESFDVGVVGEGEVTFLDLCRRLGAHASFTDVPGLVFRNGPSIVKTKPREKILDLDTIPLPAYDLFPRARYYWVMSQRGCPFTCSYCFNPNGRLPRQRSVAHVMAEIRMILDDLSAKEFRFADELFSANIPRTHELLDAMIAARVPGRSRFWVETHVAFVNAGLFRHLKKAGCFRVGMGIESGDEATLAKMHKGTNKTMIERAFLEAREAGIDTESFFILGHPGESWASMKKTISFAAKLNPTLPIFGVMVPYPGTEIGRLAAAKHKGYELHSLNWSDLNKQIGGGLSFGNLRRWQIELLQIFGYVTVFVRNRRWRSLLKFLWQYRAGGWNLFLKIVLGALSSSRKRSVPQEGFEKKRFALISAADDWARTQKESALYMRRNAEPESIRVIGRSQHSNIL